MTGRRIQRGPGYLELGMAYIVESLTDAISMPDGSNAWVLREAHVAGVGHDSGWLATSKNRLGGLAWVGLSPVSEHSHWWTC